MEFAATVAVPVRPHTACHEDAVLGSPVTPEIEMILAAAKAAASAARWASALAWYSVPMSMESAAIAIIATIEAATSARVTPRSFWRGSSLHFPARRISGESMVPQFSLSAPASTVMVLGPDPVHPSEDATLLNSHLYG